MKFKYLIILSVLACFSIGSQSVHLMKKGETIYSLARKYNTTVNDIVTLNDIEDINSITVGSEIKIPVENDRLTTYKVKKGDTLYSISKKFNLTVSQVKEYNNLKDGDIISLGQVLKISARITPNESIVIKTDDISDDKTIPYWPLKGEISTYSGRIKGVEIKGEPGDYIQAVSKGKVIWYDSYKGIGKVVLIEGDNGYDYLYGTKESLNVKMGGSIKAGDKLGRLKEDNTSIIFSVFKNGKPLSDLSRAPR